MGYDIGIGHDNPGSLAVGRCNIDGFAGLNAEGLLIPQVLQGLDNLAVFLPVSSSFSPAAVDNQVLPVNGNLRMQIIPQHAQSSFRIPISALESTAFLVADRSHLIPPLTSSSTCKLRPETAQRHKPHQ